MKKNSKKNIVYIILIILLAVVCFVAIDIMRDNWKKKHNNIQVSLDTTVQGHFI